MFFKLNVSKQIFDKNNNKKYSNNHNISYKKNERNMHNINNILQATTKILVLQFIIMDSRNINNRHSTEAKR